MKPLFCNIAVVLLGIVVGSLVNRCLIMVSGKVILAYLPMAWLGSPRALGVKDGALL